MPAAYRPLKAVICFPAGREHRRGSSVGGGGGGRRRGFVGRSLDRVFGRRRVAPYDDEPLVRAGH